MGFNFGPHCPECGEPAPLRLLVWGIGKPFDCSGCGSSLVAPNRVRHAMIALFGIVAWYRLEDAYSGWKWKAGVFLLVFTLVGLVSWLRMRVKRVDPPEAR